MCTCRSGMEEGRLAEAAGLAEEVPGTPCTASGSVKGVNGGIASSNVGKMAIKESPQMHRREDAFKLH